MCAIIYFRMWMCLIFSVLHAQNFVAQQGHFCALLHRSVRSKEILPGCNEKKSSEKPPFKKAFVIYLGQEVH